MENGTSSPEETVKRIYEFAADLMVNQKKSAAETRQILIQQGLDEESANVVVENLEKQIKEAKKSRANKDILYGSLWCFGGLIITVATYSAASSGGTYVVTWGAIIFGGIQLVRGLANLSGD